MIFNPNLKPLLELDACLQAVNLGSWYLTPMSLRFSRLHNGIVYCKTLVGSSPVATPSLYKGEDMWACLAPLVPYLPELCAATGDVLHLMAIENPDNTAKRYPIMLVETADIDPAQAASFSRGNLSSYFDNRQPSFDKAIAFVRQRNQAWLKAHDISFQSPRTRERIISDIEALLAELKTAP